MIECFQKTTAKKDLLFIRQKVISHLCILLMNFLTIISLQHPVKDQPEMIPLVFAMSPSQVQMTRGCCRNQVNNPFSKEWVFVDVTFVCFCSFYVHSLQYFASCS